jgi:hypothetical protein
MEPHTSHALTAPAAWPTAHLIEATPAGGRPDYFVRDLAGHYQAIGGGQRLYRDGTDRLEGVVPVTLVRSHELRHLRDIVRSGSDRAVADACRAMCAGAMNETAAARPHCQERRHAETAAVSRSGSGRRVPTVSLATHQGDHGGADEQHNTDKTQPEQSLKHESDDRQDQPGDEQHHYQSSHVATVRPNRCVHTPQDAEDER